MEYPLSFNRTTEGATQTDRAGEQCDDDRVVAGNTRFECNECGQNVDYPSECLR